MSDGWNLSPRAAALWAAIRNMGSTKPVDERAEAAKAAAEDVSKAMPASVMPRDAIERKRKQMQRMDEMMRER